MPIYEYACTACDHRADILHGINDLGPHFCPSCGKEGTMRKLFAPPTIHYRGSGWAKKDRGSGGSRSGKPAAASQSASGDEGSSAGAAPGDGSSPSSPTSEQPTSGSGD